MLSDEDKRDINRWIEAHVKVEFLREKEEAILKETMEEEVRVRNRVILALVTLVASTFFFVLGFIIGLVLP